MTNSTQLKWVTEQLEKKGEITRNECLQHYISRLGAIIHIMKKDGWTFATSTRPTRKPDGTEGKDFVYTLVSKPLKKTNQVD